MDTTKFFNLINTVSFFDNFTRTEKQKISRLTTDVLRFEPSEVIIRDGELEDMIYILLKGTASVVKFKPQKKLVAKLKPNSIFGELAWLSKRPRITSVVAETQAIAMRLDLNNIGKYDFILRDKIKDKIIFNLINRIEEMNKKFAGIGSV